MGPSEYRLGCKFNNTTKIILFVKNKIFILNLQSSFNLNTLKINGIVKLSFRFFQINSPIIFLQRLKRADMIFKRPNPKTAKYCTSYRYHKICIHKNDTFSAQQITLLYFFFRLARVNTQNLIERKISFI